MVGQDEDEEEAGEAGDEEEDPKEEVVDLLGEHLPIAQDLIQLEERKRGIN